MLTQKQTLAAGIGAIVIVALAGFFVYRAYHGASRQGNSMQENAVPAQSQASAQAVTETPSDPEGISQSIQAQSEADLSAMDSEEAGETAQIQADSQSVNNLGNSYDENAY